MDLVPVEKAVVSHVERPIMDGTQHLFSFENGWGASVVKHFGSYGGPQGFWELAVLDRTGDLNYSTPITSDVIGWLTDSDVVATLVKIAALDTCPANPPKTLPGGGSFDDD